MRHKRHYTLKQALALRPWVAERVRRLADAQGRLVALGARAEQALSALDPGTGGSYPGQDAAGPLVSLSRVLTELEAVDIVVRDVESGLVDFPSLRDGEEIYLCWLVGEEEIAYWHHLDAGFAGRRPL